MKVLIFPRLSDESMKIARSVLPEFGLQDIELESIALDATEEDLVRAFTSSDVLVGFVSKPLPPRAVAAMGSLKLVQLLSAGYNALDVKAMREMRVPVATNGGANSVAVAEHTVLLMLAVYKNLCFFDADVKKGGWRKGPPGSQMLCELAGKTVGLVGLGMIGREVAKRLQGFDTKVLYYDAFRPDATVEGQLGVKFSPLEDMLPVVDILSLHVPLLPETRNMIGRRELDLMKKSAVLINTCRGAVVDNEALYEALRDGVIAGAGLDTVEPEPPPPNAPLLSLPNVILTPHIAGHTEDSWPKRLRNAFTNVRRLVDGQPLLWIIPELR